MEYGYRILGFKMPLLKIRRSEAKFSVTKHDRIFLCQLDVITKKMSERHKSRLADYAKRHQFLRSVAYSVMDIFFYHASQ